MERDRRLAGAAPEPARPTEPAAEPEPVVGKRTLAGKLYRHAEDGEGLADHPAVDAALARIGAGQALPVDVQHEMQGVLGVTLDRVRVHTDDVAAAAARTVHASAFTVGEDIFFAEGAFAPGTARGTKLLAHELAHVVQGWQGRTTSSGERSVSQPGEQLEREAETLAARAVAPGPAHAGPVVAPAGPAPQATLYRSATGDVSASPEPREPLEEVYRRYRIYKAAQRVDARDGMIGGMNARAAVAARTQTRDTAEELQVALRPHGFRSIAAFERFIAKREAKLVGEAARTSQALLAEYAARLATEANAYGDPKAVAELYQQLAPYRAQHARFAESAAVANGYQRDSELARLPGNAHLQPTITGKEAAAAHRRADQAKDAARAELAGLAARHPVFHEDGLPDDKRLDKQALATAGEAALGPLIQAQIARRLGFIGQAHDLLASEPAVVCRSTALMQRFYGEQAIAEGSLDDMILRDRSAGEEARAAQYGIALALLGIALAVISFGTAVPAIAAGAAAASLGLSAPAAYDEYKAYAKQLQLANAGYADDPSVAWLVLAVVGALLDLGAAARAARAVAVVSQLGRDAKALSAGKKLTEFTAKVDAVEGLEPSVAAAVKDAAARQATTVERHALERSKDLRDAIREELEAARSEHAALLKQPGRPARALQDKLAEIRELERELGRANRHVDEAGGKLAAAEREAAKLELSAYDRLRAAVPDPKARERALRGITRDQVGPLKTARTQLSVDHIVSVREIADMDGFTRLAFADQKAIVDMPINLIPMDAAANSSKGAQSWRAWRQASRFYDEATIAKMIEREAVVRAQIEAEVRRMVAEVTHGKP